jgi:hypothetical protein
MVTNTSLWPRDRTFSASDSDVKALWSAAQHGGDVGQRSVISVKGGRLANRTTPGIDQVKNEKRLHPIEGKRSHISTKNNSIRPRG